jgi:thymidine kinase
MGEITVYTGPMFCGKSLYILVAGEREEIAGKKVLAFKPKRDTRTPGFIQSRTGFKREAIEVDKIYDILQYDADVYLIDEFQFLRGCPADIRAAADYRNKKFYIAGLNMTSEKKPFGSMPEMLCYADHIEVISAICMECKSDHGVYCKYVDGKTKDVVIGDKEYIAVCRECSIKDEKNEGITLHSVEG